MANLRRTIRRSLFKNNPLCHWCGITMQLEANEADDYATLDHLYPRGDPRRGGNEWDIEKIVLACLKCNLARGNTRI